MGLNDERETLHGELRLLTAEFTNGRSGAVQRNIELEKLIEEKNHWLATAAHDLRNPASAILVSTELLMEETLSDEHKMTLQLIHTSCEFMLHLLSDLSDIANADSRMSRILLEPTDLKALAEECISLSRPLALRKDTQLAFHYQHPIPEIAVDRQKLHQVFMNLIGNAIQYSPNGATVEVFAVLDNGRVLVSVKDNRPGIPSDELNKIFTPFQKTRSRAAASEPGTGLELAMCKRIVERHEGRIWAESRPEGGAAFYFSLPMDSDRIGDTSS